MNRWFWPRGRMYRNGLAAVGYFAESIQLRPSGAWKFRREERLHGKCGDWRTLLW